MVDAEEYFPRGGKKPTTTYFRQNDNFLGAPEKAEKKKRRQKKKSEDDDGYLSDDFTEEFDQSYKTCGIFLNYKVVKEGLLLLGRVRQVFETKINVSLPCRMHGSVMACHISEAYNNLLEAYVNDKVEQVRELPQMFRPGQYVALKVLEVSQNSLTLSMMPQHINADRKSTDLHKGALLQAAVSSIEDHGYVMDIGIPNTRAFLAKKTCNPEVELDIGVLTWVTIKSLSADCKVVTLSSELGALQRSFQRNSGVIYPGTAVDFTVHKALDNGIEGHILNNQLAYIQRHQVDTVKGKKPALGQKIRARLLYSVPPHHTPFLTMRGVFDSMIPTLRQEQIHQDGDIIEEAQVLKTWGHSVLLRLSARSSGVLTSRRGRHDSTDDYDITKAYPIGSTHRVRVLCYNLSDYVYSLSDDPAVVRLRHFKLSQLRVGELVPGTLSEVSDGHLRVAVGRLSGYVPRAHMTETGVFVDPKKASNCKLSRKYKVGQEVQARVLAIDEAKNSLVLTLKPSLLAPDLPLLMDYSERHIGKMYTGVISHIKNYLLVSFFNNVVVYVPGRLVGSQPGDLTHAFHIGQIVKCTILSVTPEAEKMSGSLTSEPFDPSEKGIKKAVKRKNAGVAKEQSESNGTDDENNEDQENGSDPDVRQVQSDETSQKKKRKKTEDKTADLNEDAENSETPMDIDKNEKTDIKSRKKKKKDKSDVKVDDITEAAEKYTKASKNKVNNVDQRDKNNTEIKEGSKKNKILKNKQLSEESDIQDDRDVLTPQEQSLVDLSDCDTEKLCKKRIVSLLKAINARTQRISRVEKKMASKESRGLTRKNKKFHTAMNLEKLNNEDRIKKFFKVIEKAQEKLKEFQKASELEKAMKLKGDLRAKIEAKRKEKKDRENEGTKNSKKEVEKVKGPNKLEGKEELKKVEASKLDKTKEITKAANDVEQKPKENKLNKEQNKVNGNERSKKRQKPDIVKIKPLEPVLEVPSAKEFWSIEEKKIEDVKDDSSSSDEEEEEKPKKKRKKLSPAEKAAKAREEEERLREIEKRAIESENSPRSSEQFERALLAQPNCSELWIAYMAFHLQSTEIEKARSVARKALNTINFREEGEKLNVWLALLNLEHRFGTKETQQKTLEEALQMNDTYSVHSKVLDILVETSKQQELAALVELMMRRYKTLEAYNACGAACYRAGLVDKARHVMQKGMLVLEKKEHVSLVVKFAVMERARAVPEGRERSEALLEQLLATYPQRVDVVAVYCDMLFKDGDIQRVRQLMGRMTSLNLPARKMKVLFKKWIEIEQKIGDDEHAENVRQSAMKFLDKAKF